VRTAIKDVDLDLDLAAVAGLDTSLSTVSVSLWSSFPVLDCIVPIDSDAGKVPKPRKKVLQNVNAPKFVRNLLGQKTLALLNPVMYTTFLGLVEYEASEDILRLRIYNTLHGYYCESANSQLRLISHVPGCGWHFALPFDEAHNMHT